VDSGKYAESWELAADSFQRTISKEEWVARLEKVRQPLGNVLSRKMSSTKLSAGGTRFEVRFTTSFDRLPKAVETVTFALQPNKEREVIGYLIRPAGWRKYRGQLLHVFPFASCLLLGFAIAYSPHSVF